MAFLAPADRSILTDRFDDELAGSIKLVLFTEPRSGLYVPGIRTCESCADTEALLSEVVELSEHLTLEVHNIKEQPQVAVEWGVTHAPTIAVVGTMDQGIRFMGMPSGYEFTSLIETIVATSGGGSSLSDETLEKLGSLEADIDIKTFSTPT